MTHTDAGRDTDSMRVEIRKIFEALNYALGELEHGDFEVEDIVNTLRYCKLKCVQLAGDNQRAQGEG